MFTQNNFLERFPTIQLDPDCARQLDVTSTQIEYKGRTLVRTETSCSRCATCVVAFAGEIGQVQHMRDAQNAFCAPGQRIAEH